MAREDGKYNPAGYNFCAHYLGWLKEKGLFDNITDGFVEIDTIKILKPIKFIYHRPRLIYDSFLKEKIIVEPEIEYLSYSDIRKLGFIIISQIPNKKWFGGQNYAYKLVKENLNAAGIKNNL